MACALVMTAGAFGQPPPEGSTAGASVPEAWQGDAGVVVVATDETGAPVPGVAVTLRLADAAFGIRGVFTDDQGRAEWLGLAAGEWQIELQREGFMLVTAYVKLQPGRDPVVAFASRQRTGSYWAELAAVYLQPGTEVVPEVAAGRSSPKEARRADERERKQELAEEKRLERESRRGRLARVLEPVEPTESAKSAGPKETEEPKPQATPAEPAQRPAEVAKPVASPEPSPTMAAAPKAEPRESEPAKPTPAEPEPSTVDVAPKAPPEPESATVAATTAEPPVSPKPSAQPSVTPSPPAPEPRQALRLLPNPDLLPAGACPECRPGEWSVSASIDATPSSEGATCDPAARGFVEEATRAISASFEAAATGFAGALRAADGNDVLRLVASDRRAEIAAALESAVSAGGACPVVAVVLPAGARYIGFRYQAGEARSLSECPPDSDCQVGEARFTGPPLITKTDRLTVVAGQFANGSAQRARVGRITVYFVPPRGWLPPR